MTDEDLQKQIAADMLGMQMAFGCAIRALIATHPDPVALVRELKKEKEETVVLLNASPIPDRAIDAFLASMPLVDADIQRVPPDPDTQAGAA